MQDVSLELWGLHRQTAFLQTWGLSSKGGGGRKEEGGRTEKREGKGRERGRGRGETKLQQEWEPGREDGGESPWIQPFLISARGLTFQCESLQTWIPCGSAWTCHLPPLRLNSILPSPQVAIRARPWKGLISAGGR